LLEQYQKLINQNVLCEDKAQHYALKALSQLSEQLVTAEHDKLNKKKHSLGFLAKIPVKKNKPAIQGLYFYG
jgi:predicted ATPase